MRRVFRILDVVCVLGIAGCMVFLYLILRAPVFPEGERHVFFLGESSSAEAVESTEPLLTELLYSPAGESVQYDGNRYEELKEKFRAKLLFREEACGVTNYYLYSPLIRGGIELYGKRVNLHIAVSAQKTAAGTPILFGGF